MVLRGNGMGQKGVASRFQKECISSETPLPFYERGAWEDDVEIFIVEEERVNRGGPLRRLRATLRPGEWVRIDIEKGVGSVRRDRRDLYPFFKDRKRKNWRKGGEGCEKTEEKAREDVDRIGFFWRLMKGR